MNCKQARKLIVQQPDRRLREHERLRLGRHLDECAACAAEAARLARLQMALGAVPQPVMPRSVVSDVMRQIRSAPARERTAGWLPTRAAAVLAGAALLAVAVVAGPRAFHKPPTPGTPTTVVAGGPELDDVLAREHALFSAAAGAFDNGSWLVLQAEESARIIREHRERERTR